MQKWFLNSPSLIKYFIGSLFLSQLFFSSPSLAKLITDEFVHNLSCEKLNTDQIFSHLQSDVYNQDKILPVVNWSFRFGAYDLANCWSLSRAQRLLFYLGRQQHQNGNRLQNTVKTLNIFRGIEVLQKYPDYSFIPLDGPLTVESDFFRSLQMGFIETRGIIKEHRNLRSEIEKYQAFRFHQFIKNAKYIDSIDSQDQNRNQQLFNYLINQLSKSRIVMLNIKNQLMVQHVVLAYGFFVRKNEIEIYVYDSNSPYKRQTIIWSKLNKYFTASDILSQISGAVSVDAPTVLFIVDEEERLEIEKFILNYYQNLCQTNR